MVKESNNKKPQKVGGIQFLECNSGESVCLEAAAMVEQLLQEKPNASIVFSTGNTPLRMYQALRKTPYSVWAQSRLFHLDEYMPPPGTEKPYAYQTYEEYMKRELWDYVDGKKYFAKDYLNNPNEYDQLVRANNGPDLVILGVGSNGHIAFNEPDSDPDAPTRLVALEEQTIWDNFGSLNKRGFPTRAITLGLGTIFQAKRIILLATGSKKHNIIRKAFDPQTPPSANCPASWLKRHPNITVITDFPFLP